MTKQLLDTSRCLNEIRRERRELSGSVERWRDAQEKFLNDEKTREQIAEWEKEQKKIKNSKAQ